MRPLESPGMDEGLASSGEGNHREERSMVLFRLQKDHVGEGCEMHNGGGELHQGLWGRLGLGQGHGCRGDLVWGLVIHRGGRAHSHWGTRTWEPGNLGGLRLSEPEEETLKFYITSCSFCLCNSACSLQSLDHVGHAVSESGDLEYSELELVSLALVLAPANLLDHACS